MSCFENRQGYLLNAVPNACSPMREQGTPNIGDDNADRHGFRTTAVG